MRCNILKKASGFTLIELLVAISILAIIAVLGWRGLDSIVRARMSLTSELEQTRGIQISFAQLENDCAHLAGDNLLAGRESLRASQQSLVMVRTVNEDQQPTRLQVVAYRLVEGVLSRRESPATRDLKMLDEVWQSAISDTDNMAVVELQSKVIALEMRTWNPNENNWRIAGSDGGDATLSGVKSGKTVTPKTGLEVSLQLQGREHPLLKIFLLGAA
ncbi:prepilin-type N-terminal cleavage/methylation domain-containing protein [Undibacterium piscinae]|jgi:general secretion pathway protein J|uniref:Prepilin-type N-terminal cleavage/methylation domain-containing protein n=1 Tax=Undibacterium piscinae TaxID=2495591 RepID=A0A6M4A3L6_9BURK|nr:prepilin-type N-terminal cleavage/methylation domain-containing protein [Undibacterium piscinae]